MKKLTGKHIFQMAKIIKAADLKDELGSVIAKNKEGASIDQVGIEAVMTIISACGNDQVERKMYEMLDDLFEAKVEDMSLEAIATSFKQLAKENDLLSFFKSAGLLKQ